MENNTGLIKKNSELKELAREHLKGKWAMVILLCIVYYAIANVIARFIPIAGPIITFIIAGPLYLGFISCFLKLTRDNELRFENLFSGFKRFGTAFLLQLLMTIFIVLWSFLAVVPGIIAAYRYGMAFFILNDHPEMSAGDALKNSKQMMIGHKGRLFGLQISFIGWGIIAAIPIGIGAAIITSEIHASIVLAVILIIVGIIISLWLTPYIYTTTTEFYENLKNAQTKKEPSKAE